jgi:DNA-binding PadR family transcriptional regulator
MHGYQIIQELTERTGGVWRPSPGSVYPTLQQLQDEELVREAQSDSGKRVYELTDAGREQAAGATAPWSAVAGESADALVSLRDLAHQVMAATRQVAHAGTAAQLESAQAILRDARRALYRLLAEDAPDADEPADD